MIENVVPFRSAANPAPTDAAALEKAENERAVLGAVIVAEAAYRSVAATLRPEHFAFPVHGRIYAAVGEMIERHGRVDLRLLRENIGTEPSLEPSGGTGAYLQILLKDATAATFAPAFARKIVETWMRREIAAVNDEARQADLPPTAVAARIDAELKRILAAHHDDDGLTVIHFDDMQPQLGSDYLVKGLLGSTGMTVIYGAPGSGKTFFALRLGLDVASGQQFFGLKTQKRGVVYIAAEAGRSIANRVAAAKRDFPPGTPFVAITSPVDLCSNGADLERLVSRINRLSLGAPVGLIIIDTLSRVMAGGNENAPDDMGALVANCDRLRAETETALILVHHTGKDAAKGARGHSLLLAATDTEIEVAQDGETKVSVARVTKQRELPTEGSFSFRLSQVEIARDDDGEPITSCVVEACDSAEAETTRNRAKPLPPLARKFLSALHDALAATGAVIHRIAGRNAVTVDAWKRECRRLGLLDEGKPACERALFSKNRLVLIAANVVVVNGEYVWTL